ncbi:hypothetical protein GA0061102_106312 [Rhizobium miluonense]|uniref:Uncharacterized protein n=2 Tax=Rhizobium miluonense TaxID=411945 RepID=A0A1C3X753_9HYPH|nr:hypothetical protein [Rhizobium miluonense]SCB48100.1 hypothetical protein GA0061102_106312 [Rhizobium miluonense]
MMMSDTRDPLADEFPEFGHALARLPDGYMEGRFQGRPWSATVKRSADGKRIWLYGEELGGTDIVSFNLYVLSGAKPALKPCEMSSSKVVDFVLGFRPTSVRRS